MVIRLSLCCCILAVSVTVRAQYWHPIGMAPDSVTAALTDTRTGRMFIGTATKGVFTSLDTGHTWTPINQLTDSRVSCLTQLVDGRILCGGPGGLFVCNVLGPWSKTSIAGSVTFVSRHGLAVVQDSNGWTLNFPDSALQKWTVVGTGPGRVTCVGSDTVASDYVGTSEGWIGPRQKKQGQWIFDTTHLHLPVANIAVGYYPNCADVIPPKTYVVSGDFGLLRFPSLGVESNGLPPGHLLSFVATDYHHGILAITDSGYFIIDLHHYWCAQFDTGKWQQLDIGLLPTARFTTISDDGNLLVMNGNQVFTSWTIGRYRKVVNTRSNIKFYQMNDGRSFYADNGNEEGMTWPRGSNNSYLYSGGIWFATKKQIQGKRKKLAELSYNPNDGRSWFVPGEALAVNDHADSTWKYFPYFSTSFDSAGNPIVHDANTPIYPWPIRATKPNLKSNFNFGTYVSDVTQRSTAGKPVMLSDEDIVTCFTDADPVNNPEFKPGTGYPFGINVLQTIYSWGFGRYRDVIFVRYNITNASPDSLIDNWIAPALDPDLPADGSAANDFNSYVSDSVAVANAYEEDLSALQEPYRSHPSLLNMAYQYRKNASSGLAFGMIGFSVVESPVIDPATGNSIPNEDSIALNGYGSQSLFSKFQEGLATFRQWNINNDPPTQDLRYDFVSSRTRDFAAPQPADQRVMIGTGPFTLPPGQHVTMTLAIGIAQPSTTDSKKNFGGLLQLMAFAKDFFATAVSDPSDSSKTIVQHFANAGTSGLQVASADTARIECFPNPAASTVRIEGGGFSVDGLEVYDMLGRQVRVPVSVARGPGSGLELDVRSLPEGVYYLRARQASARFEIIR